MTMLRDPCDGACRRLVARVGEESGGHAGERAEQDAAIVRDAEAGEADRRARDRGDCGRARSEMPMTTSPPNITAGVTSRRHSVGIAEPTPCRW